MTSTNRTELLDKVVDHALEFAKEAPWNKVALADLAGAAHATLADFAAMRITKARITHAIDRRFDRAALATVKGVDRSETVRDRLFDAAMRRFDALEGHRDAMMSILLAENSENSAKAARAARRLVTAAWLLEAAGIEAAGGAGVARAIGLARIMRKAEAAWRLDGVDLARTMASLDQGLRDAEDFIKRTESFAFPDVTRFSPAMFSKKFNFKSWPFGKGRGKSPEAPPEATEPA